MNLRGQKHCGRAEAFPLCFEQLAVGVTKALARKEPTARQPTKACRESNDLLSQKVTGINGLLVGARPGAENWGLV